MNRKLTATLVALALYDVLSRQTNDAIGEELTDGDGFTSLLTDLSSSRSFDGHDSTPMCDVAAFDANDDWFMQDMADGWHDVLAQYSGIVVDWKSDDGQSLVHRAFGPEPFAWHVSNQSYELA